MRLSNAMITRNYQTHLKTNQNRLYQTTNKLSSFRKFSSTAEDVSSGLTAMQLRRQASRLEHYKDNVTTLQNTYDMAETSLRDISTMAQSIRSKYLQGSDAGVSDGDRAIIKNELEQYREEILARLNEQAGDRYIFGGTNSSVKPFEFDTDTNILYYTYGNGTRVDVTNMTKEQYDDVMKDVSYSDIGFNMQINGGVIDGQTAFKSTFSGLEFIGFGEDNLINRLQTLIDGLDDRSTDRDELLQDFIDSTDNFYVAVTSLGAQTGILESTASRLDLQILNVKERQEYIEQVDPAEAITDWQMQQLVYNAMLSMGQGLLQPSLFNYIS